MARHGADGDAGDVYGSGGDRFLAGSDGDPHPSPLPKGEGAKFPPPKGGRVREGGLDDEKARLLDDETPTPEVGLLPSARPLDDEKARLLDGGDDPEVGLLPSAGVIDDEKARLLDDEYAKLAKALGYLPLAMEQAAALMLQRRMTPTAYLTAFQQDYAKIRKREHAPDRYHATVTTTWEMAFEQARHTEGAAELLNLCSFFAPDSIPLQVIQDGADLLPDELAAVMADEEWGVGDALAALQSYSLLTVTDGDKLAMHRLVQLVARERMGAGEQGREGEGEQGSGGAGAKEWVDVALKVLSKAYNFDKHDMGTWAQCGHVPM